MAPSWSEEQLSNARTIAAVGRQMKMSSRDILIAIMTAMQESGLRNVGYGDRDSLGLFQQRPSQGWGTPQQVMNPIYAATKFFTTLRGVKNRNNLSLTMAAQTVQRSAYPYAYAKHEDSARRLMNTIGEKGGLPSTLQTPALKLDDYGVLAAPEQPQTVDQALKVQPAGIEEQEPGKVVSSAPGAGLTTDPVVFPEPLQPQTIDPELMPGEGHDFPNLTYLSQGGARQKMINAALSQLGTPYSWGGGDVSGATYGIGKGAGTRGFDCSGLVHYALNAAGVRVGDMVASQQMKLGKQVPVAQLQPGDLVATPSGSHIAIYLGNGQMIEAPSTGDVVKVSPVRAGMVGIALSLASGRQSATMAAPSASAGTVKRTGTSGSFQSYQGI